MVELNDTHVFLSGGYDGSSQIKSTYIFSDKRGWQKMQDLSVARDDHACALVDEHTVLVVGGHGSGAGNTTELFDLTTEEWREGPPLPSSSNEARMFTADGQTYHIGGWKSSVKIYLLHQVSEFWWEWKESGSGKLSEEKTEFDVLAVKVNECRISHK